MDITYADSHILRYDHTAENQPSGETVECIVMQPQLIDYPISISPKYPNIQVLHADNCGLRDLRYLDLEQLGRLTHLTLRQNGLESLAGLPKLDSLEHLDISLNKFPLGAEQTVMNPLCRLRVLLFGSTVGHQKVPAPANYYSLSSCFLNSFSVFRVLFMTQYFKRGDLLLKASSSAYSVYAAFQYYNLQAHYQNGTLRLYGEPQEEDTRPYEISIYSIVTGFEVSFERKIACSQADFNRSVTLRLNHCLQPFVYKAHGEASGAYSDLDRLYVRQTESGQNYKIILIKCCSQVLLLTLDHARFCDFTSVEKCVQDELVAKHNYIVNEKQAVDRRIDELHYQRQVDNYFKNIEPLAARVVSRSGCVDASPPASSCADTQRHVSALLSPARLGYSRCGAFRSPTVRPPGGRGPGG